MLLISASVVDMSEAAQSPGCARVYITVTVTCPLWEPCALGGQRVSPLGQ